MWFLAVTFFWMALRVLLVPRADGQQIDSPRSSCLDHLKSGTTKNGYYSVIDKSGSSLTVYCDFESEPGSAWTLVMSWSFHYKNLRAFKRIPLTEDVKVNEKTPNWNIYRQSKKAMNFLKSQSSHWRATCSFNRVKFDYRDYLRGSFRDTDITTYLGDGTCQKVEFINIRGNAGYQTTIGLWQRKNICMLHTDSSIHRCLYDGTSGATGGEDNFGHYHITSRKFRCTSDPYATTQYWFGGYV